MNNSEEKVIPTEQYNAESLETIKRLSAENAILQSRLDELTGKYNFLLEKYLLKVKKLFGRAREAIDGQTVLEGFFNEAEVESDTTQPDPDIEEAIGPMLRQAKKYIGQKKAKLDGLPVERVDYDIPEEERICDNCGSPLPELKPEIRSRIEVIPAQIKVIEEVRHVYADCNKCKKDDQDDAVIIKAPIPQSAIPHSIATEATIAFVITDKYQFGLPLYRQEAQWRMLDMRISRQTMSNWIILATDSWLKLIYDRLHWHLIKRDIIMADESSLQVLHEKDRPATSTSYMWLYCSGRDGPPIILFNYQQTRETKHPEKFLSGFSGYLCTDGYAAYYRLPSVINVSCFSHARRYFYDAFMLLPKTARNKTSAAFIGLNYCNKLFDVERDIRQMSYQDRYEERQLKSQPILNEFKQWLDMMRPSAENKSHLGKAVNYCLNYWETLCNYMLDGRLDIDNNKSERQIKGYVIGRKGWLFSNTPNGANASAIAYSIVHTAIENRLKPFEYIQYLLKSLPNSDVKDQAVLDSFLPWSDSIPDSCRLKK